MPGIWLIGSEGYLGRALKQQLVEAPAAQDARGQNKHKRCNTPQWRIWLSQHQVPEAADYLNLAEPDLTPWTEILPQLNWALICAGRPLLHDCHRNPTETERVNVWGPLALAQALHQAGVVPVLFSSDYVFGGDRAPYSESDSVCPLNAYGEQKATLEQGLQAALPPDSYLLLRLTKLYDLEPDSQGLLADMARAWRLGKSISAATDQHFNPLWIADAVQAILSLLSHNARGLYHLGGPEGISRYQLAQKLAQALEMDPASQQALIHPIALQDLQEPFLRPKDTRLSTRRLEATLPDWQPLPLQRACADFHTNGQAMTGQARKLP